MEKFSNPAKDKPKALRKIRQKVMVTLLEGGVQTGEFVIFSSWLICEHASQVHFSLFRLSS